MCELYINNYVKIEKRKYLLQLNITFGFFKRDFRMKMRTNGGVLGQISIPIFFLTMSKQMFVPPSNTINMKVKDYYLSQFAHVATEPFPKDIRNE